MAAPSAKLTATKTVLRFAQRSTKYEFLAAGPPRHLPRRTPGPSRRARQRVGVGRELLERQLPGRAERRQCLDERRWPPQGELLGDGAEYTSGRQTAAEATPPAPTTTPALGLPGRSRAARALPLNPSPLYPLWMRRNPSFSALFGLQGALQRTLWDGNEGGGGHGTFGEETGPPAGGMGDRTGIWLGDLTLNI